MRSCYLLVVAPCVLLFGACQEQRALPVPSAAALPAPEALQPVWNAITPGGETLCSNGTPYVFFVRPADPEKLLVYFQGGGACWFGENCSLKSRPTYAPTADDEDNPVHEPVGIFDLENPANPFAQYTMVFVPYCTGDVHLGNRITTYAVPATDSTDADTVAIHHHGYLNALTALSWTFANYEAPEDVFVAGSSAGAIASPFYADVVAGWYREASVVQLGDAAGGYRSIRRTPVLERWGTQTILPDDPRYAVPLDSLSFETFYTAAGTRHPAATFAQFNTAEDEVQRFFLRLSGDSAASLQPLLEANLADVRAAIDNFHVYTAGGTEHTILQRPAFYTLQVGGVRFRDWVAALAAGEAVADVTCSDCAAPAAASSP